MQEELHGKEKNALGFPCIVRKYTWWDGITFILILTLTANI